MNSQNLVVRSFLSTFLILLSFITGLSQDWPKIYGDNIIAYGQEITEVYDKGYLIRGSILKDFSTFKFGWLIKIDINGDVLWDKKFGDPAVENFFLDFDKTSDNGLILSGGTAQEDIERDPLFVKLDLCGEIEWCKIFLSPNDNTASGVISLPDSTFLGMLQYYEGDAQEIRISLVKMDTSGEPIWIKHLAQEDSTIFNEEGYNLYLSTDSNFLVSGRCFCPSKKPFFIKTDTSGEQLWDIRWPYGSGGSAGQSVFSSNSMIYNATHLQFAGNPKVPYLLKFNESGNIIDQYPMMGDTIVNGGASSLLMFDDSTLYSGTTWTNDPMYEDFNCDILKTDTLGSLIIQRHLINDENPPTDIIKSFDSKILAISTNAVDNNWDIYMWKMNGDLEDDSLYTQPMTYDSLCPYKIISDTVDLNCGLFVNIDEIPTKEEYEATIKISPNPARDWIVLTFPDVISQGEVELVVYNVFGQEVLNMVAIPNNRMASLNISSLSPGMYVIVSTIRRDNILTGKFIVER
jgi:hypothetical protein